MVESRPLRQRFDTVPAEVAAAAKRVVQTSVRVSLKTAGETGLVTHHEWTWALKNLSDKTVESLYFFLEGDVPRAFPFLHVKVTDEKGNSQGPILVIKDHSLRKEFYVILRKAIKPYERNRTFVVKYDWEETKRTYVYGFQSRCEEFNLELRMPKNQTISAKAFWVDFKRGTKRRVSMTPVHQQKGKWQRLIWSFSNVPALSNLKFQW